MCSIVRKTQDSNMKKYLFTFLLFTLFLPNSILANVDDDMWFYIFNLEYKNGLLQVDSSAKEAYRQSQAHSLRRSSPVMLHTTE